MSNLTQEEIDRVRDITILIDTLENQLKANRFLLSVIQSHCSHSKLPVRELGTEYRDICPDCGYVAYCYAIGPIYNSTDQGYA